MSGTLGLPYPPVVAQLVRFALRVEARRLQRPFAHPAAVEHSVESPETVVIIAAVGCGAVGALHSP